MIVDQPIGTGIHKDHLSAETLLKLLGLSWRQLNLAQPCSLLSDGEFPYRALSTSSLNGGTSFAIKEPNRWTIVRFKPRT